MLLDFIFLRATCHSCTSLNAHYVYQCSFCPVVAILAYYKLLRHQCTSFDIVHVFLCRQRVFLFHLYSFSTLFAATRTSLRHRILHIATFPRKEILCDTSVVRGVTMCTTVYKTTIARMFRNKVTRCNTGFCFRYTLRHYHCDIV